MFNLVCFKIAVNQNCKAESRPLCNKILFSGIKSKVASYGANAALSELVLKYIDDLIQICNDANGDDPEAASNLFAQFNNVQTKIENTSSASAGFTQDMPFNKEGPPMRSLRKNAAARLRNISIIEI